jgi:hypothetical protein
MVEKQAVHIEHNRGRSAKQHHRDSDHPAQAEAAARS